MIFLFVPVFSSYVCCLGFFALYSSRRGNNHHSHHRSASTDSTCKKSTLGLEVWKLRATIVGEYLKYTGPGCAFFDTPPRSHALACPPPPDTTPSLATTSPN